MFARTLFVTSQYGVLPQGLQYSLDRMGTDYLQCPIWMMQGFYETFKPEVVIFFHHNLKEWNESILPDLEKITCHKILWDWEMPWEIDLIEKWHHPFSYILVQDKNSATELNHRLGQKKVTFVPHAADPESCKKVDVPFEYRSDLCFLGAAYPSRLRFFRTVLPKLKDYKVVIGGGGWEFLPDTIGQKIIKHPIHAEEYWRWYSGAKVALNLHRLSDEVPMANAGIVKASSPNNRFFELYMAGLYQMVDSVRLPEIKQYYDDVNIFESPDEFIVKFKGIANGSGGYRQAEGLRQQKRSLQDHKYENRFTEIISKII